MKMLIKAVLATLLYSAAFAAQADGDAANPVLKGSQVTESNLVDALAIAPPEAASGATRGFRAAHPGAPEHKAGPGRASLLITFATNSTELSTEAQGLLDTLGRALQSDTLAGFSFKVEGHADARGDAADNQRLSQERAEAVVAYLSAHGGILPERLSAVGKGSSEPMNKARVDAPENRRVTIVTMRN
ncbi:MAG: OmpA family protein [Pelomonas sp.]|nr:OmpA family protein [Roseateles sp.]